MSGISSAAYDTAASGGGGQPLGASLTWNGGSTMAVTGDSGVSPSAVFIPIAHGGVTPYTADGITLTSNPSGKIFLTASPDNVHTTLGWSGFSLNETENYTARYSVTDSAGTTKSASVSGSIRRTN